MLDKPSLVYCSYSRFKIEEWEGAKQTDFEVGVKFGDMIELDFRSVKTHEPLLCDLTSMVHAKAISAYQRVKVPCVVEHAGLILKGYESQNYPGGLTQPMWDALGASNFVASCSALGSGAIARAVIGYCDGASVKTFIGETEGTLKKVPTGIREFYWDTVFCPSGFDGKSYAEIADINLLDKIQVSQSIKALKLLIQHCRDTSPELFPGA